MYPYLLSCHNKVIILFTLKVSFDLYGLDFEMNIFKAENSVEFSFIITLNEWI